MTIQRKVCLIGEFGVGKTSLVARYVNSIFSDKYHTTVGVKIDKKTVTADGQEVVLVLWDLAGQSAVSAPKMSLVRGASAYILVADGTRRDTLLATRRLHSELTGIVGQVPFLLVVNKADLSAEWTVTGDDLDDFRRAGWPIHLTSAKDGRGVEAVFSALVARMLEQGGTTA